MELEERDRLQRNVLLTAKLGSGHLSLLVVVPIDSSGLGRGNCGGAVTSLRVPCSSSVAIGQLCQRLFERR